MSIIDTIAGLLEQAAGRGYDSDVVNQQAHALQCAALAEAAGAGPAVVAAALLHDIGHLVDAKAPGAAARGIDRQHEVIGSAWLARHFGPEVVEPVRLHVPAKRWLCWAEQSYWDGLSPASRRSLELQGGRFDDAAAEAFIAQPHARIAVDLRRWDDLAKVPGLAVPPVTHFLSAVEDSLRR